MPTVTQQKCACDSCVCIVDIKDAIRKDEKNYCSPACAEGHPDGATGCGLSGCDCIS
ncbi:MAG: metallothionein [Pseudomonadota bacterium]